MSAIFSDEVREQFQEVKSTVLTAQIEWAIAKQLFASGEDNLELLKWSADYAFWAIQRALYQSVVMAIGRLTDRPRISGHDTLSLHRLSDAIHKVDSAQGAVIIECLKDAESTFEPLRAIRDTVFAHTDLVNIKLRILPGTETVDKAIETLIDIINNIRESLGIGAEGIILKDFSRYHFHQWGDGAALLYKLRKYKESVFPPLDKSRS